MLKCLAVSRHVAHNPSLDTEWNALFLAVAAIPAVLALMGAIVRFRQWQLLVESAIDGEPSSSLSWFGKAGQTASLRMSWLLQLIRGHSRPAKLFRLHC
jgi:hypothetical protein